jgi:hypothetical protein
MLIVEYAPEGATSAIFILAPLVLGIASFWPSARGHWSGPLLAVPSLLIGLAFTWALVRSGAGYGGWPLMVYSPLQLILGIASIALWTSKRKIL